MKRIPIVILVLFVAMSAACQERIDSPQTIQWDAPNVGFADRYEIALQAGEAEPFVIGETVEQTFYLDLEAEASFGVFVVLVRSVAVTEPGDEDRSDWIRSTEPGDVALVDGEPRTFLIRLRRPAGAPTMLRVQ